MTANTVPNVLIVEDEMMLRMRAVDIVEDAGFNSVQAVNADEALSILEERTDISLLFSDIQMPGSMDGLMLAHAVHDRWPAIKIILVSGQLNPSAAERPAKSLFFGKPLSSDDMIVEIQAMVGAGALKALPSTSMLPARYPSSELTNDQTRRSEQESVLLAENDSLRLLLEQASIDAQVLLSTAGIEAKEREAADKLQKLIMEELHHRIKNTIATVGAIASQSFRGAATIASGQKAMDGRLMALGRAHDLLMQTSWSSASLAKILAGAVEPFDVANEARFRFKGADLSIRSDAVVALAMTCNELCTNTTKFGALSAPDGFVEITWAIDERDQRFRLSWNEFGGPSVEPPSRQSFGTRMMKSIGQQLNGTIELNYASSGFEYTMSVPLASIAAVAKADVAS